jgi:hypothetical protein
LKKIGKTLVEVFLEEERSADSAECLEKLPAFVSGAFSEQSNSSIAGKEQTRQDRVLLAFKGHIA